MGRYTGPVCRLCRREGTKLFLKGDRCQGGKCSLERRDRPPGMHNWRRGKISEYGQRLREKQKVKRYYGVYETQFKNYFKIAAKQKGNTGENLLTLLERRLDNVVCRAGFAYSRPQSRQIIAHGHICVNGKKLDIPSYLVKEGDVISVRKKESSEKLVKTICENHSAEAPSWIEKTPDNVEFKVVSLPVRNEISIKIDEQLIVEFCSR